MHLHIQGHHHIYLLMGIIRFFIFIKKKIALNRLVITIKELLNWSLGLKKDFLPSSIECNNPRPRSLYQDSLTMSNYSLAAYRLGSKIKKYDYNFQKHKKKWMPWKSIIEEWLDVEMEKGIFHIYSFEYLTKCTYKLFSN